MVIQQTITEMRFAFIIILLALFALGCDPDKPALPQTPLDPEILTVHNKWRSLVGVADLEWSANLAKKAMVLVDGNTCEWTINTEGLGQNSISSGASATPEFLVDIWANIGFQYYIYDLDSCTFPLLGGQPDDTCDSYKQVVEVSKEGDEILFDIGTSFKASLQYFSKTVI